MSCLGNTHTFRTEAAQGCRDKNLPLMGFWKWFPPSCSWISLWMRDLRTTFNLHQGLSSNLFNAQWQCVFTIGGQNDGPFSGRHESLDGSEETNIIIKYDINLQEQTVCKWISPGQAWVMFGLIAIKLHVLVWSGRMVYLFKQNEWCGCLFALWHWFITAWWWAAQCLAVWCFRWQRATKV